jgi:peptide/nickel transport system substrate-binding protein
MLAGCSGSSESGTTQETTTGGGGATESETQTETETEQSQSEIQTGGELVVAMQSGTETLNPHKVSFTTGITMCENMSNSLYRVTSEGKIEPDLAKEMPEISDDGTQYTVTLREGVQFHEPYKREMTAEDVVWNFRKILDKEYGAAGRGAFVGTLVGEDIDPQETVQQTGEYEVTFNLAQSYAPFLYKQASMSAFAWFSIIPPESLEEHGDDLGATDSGVWATGPFRYVPEESQAGSKFVFERNPDYFREGEGGQLPYLDRLVYKVVPEASVRSTQLKSGGVDVNESVVATEVEAMRNNSDIAVLEKPSTAKTSQWLNIVNFEPLTKKKVRKALMYAMNREAIIQTKFQGHAAIAHSPFPPWHWAYDEDAAVTYDQDVERAKQLLQDAGHAGFSFTCEPANQSKFVDVATILQQQYRQANVKMEVTPVSKGTVWDPVSGDETPGEFNSMLENFTWGFAADDYAYATFHSDAVFNYTEYADETTDELMTEARHVPERERRKELYDKVQKRITDDMPKLFLLWNNVIHGHRNRVHNLRVWPSAYMWFEDVWKES